MVLVAMAAAWPETRGDARFQMCAAAGVGCLAVSLLPHTPFYPVLHRLIPLFSAVRVPGHIGQVVLLMIAVVAGFGVAGWSRRWRNPATWPVAAAVVCALVNLEALRAPIVYRPFDSIPRVYDVLANEQGAVVAELPFYAPRDFFGNGIYMLNSTRNWRPMLNGYSGFRPTSYTDSYNATRGFPDQRSVAALEHLGVTHVIVHADQFRSDYVDELARSPLIQPVVADRDIHIYRLR
jgi:hypothetical protein